VAKNSPDPRRERPHLVETLKMIEGRPGPPREEDAPPPSTLPITPAAREALRAEGHPRLW